MARSSEGIEQRRKRDRERQTLARAARKAQPKPATDGLEWHPLAECWPLLTTVDAAELSESIKANGVRQPITLFEGKVLDGRNRYGVAMALGVECPAIEYTGDDPVQMVIDQNAKRRHMTKIEVAKAVVRMHKWRDGGRPHIEKPEKGCQADRVSPAPKSKTTTELADQAEVSEATIARAKRDVREERGETLTKTATAPTLFTPDEPDSVPAAPETSVAAKGLTRTERLQARIAELEQYSRDLLVEKQDWSYEREDLQAKVQLAIDDAERPHLAERVAQITALTAKLKDCEAARFNQATAMRELSTDVRKLKAVIRKLESGESK